MPTQTPENLSKFTDSQLHSELNKREKLGRKHNEKLMQKEIFDKWLKRSSCKFVGRAYGIEQRVCEERLAYVYVEGNSGSTYEYSIKIPESVKRYFHNAWTEETRREFKKMLGAVCEYFIDNKIDQSLKSVIELIKLSQSDPKDVKVIEEWNKSVIEVLSAFPLEELKNVQKGLYDKKFIALMKKAIKYKIANKIPDKQKLQLPTEYKTVLAISKMK